MDRGLVKCPAAAFLSLALFSCGSAPPVTSTPPAPIVFRDAAAETGLAFMHETGASGQYYMPEIMAVHERLSTEIAR